MAAQASEQEEEAERSATCGKDNDSFPRGHAEFVQMLGAWLDAAGGRVASIPVMKYRPRSSRQWSLPHRLTGGPGGGKTTAADLFRREMGERVALVPEAATMVFSGGFPRVTEPSAVHAAQRAIYHVQRNLEDVQAALYHDRVLLCDRGTVDGAAYWPGNTNGFFEDIGSTLERELARYDAVIFFESAAVGGMGIEGGNPIRNESLGAGDGARPQAAHAVVQAQKILPRATQSILLQKDLLRPGGAGRHRA
jgi:predicted ATPase